MEIVNIVLLIITVLLFIFILLSKKFITNKNIIILLCLFTFILNLINAILFGTVGKGSDNLGKILAFLVGIIGSIALIFSTIYATSMLS
jgi:hypothetical protein